MHLHTGSITASKCISEFNLLSASKYISKLARSHPQIAYLSSLDLSLQVHLFVELDLSLQVHHWTHSIAAS